MAHPYAYYMKRKLDPIFWVMFLKCIKLVIYIFDLLTDRIFGISFLHGSQSERNEAATCYEKSAHILKIVTRGTINLAHHHDERNFIYLHHSFTHPKYILENKNVVLKNVTKDAAIFFVSDKNVDPYDAKIGPFSFGNIFVTARYMVVLPLESFHRLAEEAGDPVKKNNTKITIIHMTARCGSTLLGQCLEKIANTRVISEPFSFVAINGLYCKGDVSFVEYRQILESVFRLQCKIEGGSGIDHIVMKWNPYATATIPYLKEVHPEINLILNTRNLDTTIKSWTKVENFFPLSGTLSNVFNLQGERYTTECPADFEDIKWWDWFRNVKTTSPESVTAKWVVFIWWGVLEMYRKHKSKYLLTVIYEDMQENPEKVVTKLLDVLKIPSHNTAAAMEALKVDSQGGVFGQRGLGHKKDPVEIYKEVNKLFKSLQIPFTTESTVDDLRSLIH